MTIHSRNAAIVSSAQRVVSSLALAAMLTIAFSAFVQAAVAQPAPAMPVVQGESLRRLNAMLASNLALSPENQAPTTFHNAISLADADVVARAQTLSAQAGHNGLHYDFFRFRALFDKARAIKADKVDIPAATYHIYPPVNLPAGQSLIEASLLSHVVIDGHGATLSFVSTGTPEAPLDKTYPRAGIHFGRSDHTTLRNLTVDWSDPLAVPVRISGTGQPGSPQTLTVDPAYPVNAALPIPLRGVMPYNVDQRQFIRSRDLGADGYAAWAKAYSPSGAMMYLCPPAASGVPASACFRYMGHQVYAFGTNEHLSPLPPKPGNFLAGVRDNNFAAIVADGATSYLTLSGITIYSSPGQGVVIVNAGKAIHVTHVRIVRKPDAMIAPGEPKRLISTLSDGMDVINSAGDVVVEDCEIANQADDGFNIRAAMARADVVDAHTVNVRAGAVANFYRVGGLVDVYDDKGINLIAANVAITTVAPPTPGKGLFTVGLASTSPALPIRSAFSIGIATTSSCGGPRSMTAPNAASWCMMRASRSSTADLNEPPKARCSCCMTTSPAQPRARWPATLSSPAI